MMEGKLFIDDLDAFETFGAYIAEGGYRSLVCMPPLKKPESNDWQEMDGEEFDTSSLVLDSREVTLPIAFGKGLYGRFNDFVDFLLGNPYHMFNCPAVGRAFRLRFISAESVEYAKVFGFANFKFAEDAPLSDFHYSAPIECLLENLSYTLDGEPFTRWGVRVLEGSLKEMVKPAAVKPALTRDIKTLRGKQYDGQGRVTLKAKDVNIPCLMRADSLVALWHNWDCLLYDLTRPGLRSLGVHELEQEFPFIYKSCKVEEFFPDERIWLKFVLTLTLTHDFRVADGDFLLVDENHDPIYDETAENAVDLSLSSFIDYNQ